jgi:hypothetical protein
MSAEKVVLHPTTPVRLKNLLLKPHDIEDCSKLTASSRWDDHLKLIAKGNDIDLEGACKIFHF